MPDPAAFDCERDQTRFPLPGVPMDRNAMLEFSFPIVLQYNPLVSGTYVRR